MHEVNNVYIWDLLIFRVGLSVARVYHCISSSLEITRTGSWGDLQDSTGRDGYRAAGGKGQ